MIANLWSPSLSLVRCSKDCSDSEAEDPGVQAGSWREGSVVGGGICV